VLAAKQPRAAGGCDQQSTVCALYVLEKQNHDQFHASATVWSCESLASGQETYTIAAELDQFGLAPCFAMVVVVAVG